MDSSDTEIEKEKLIMDGPSPENPTYLVSNFYSKF